MVENTTINTKRENPEKTHQNITRKRKIIQQNTNNNTTKRVIKLYCPAISKIAEVLVWEDQRLDLGTIARTFTLEPATLKLNGYFISRGVDLIASCVTWKSLVSFFSSKGLSTGEYCSNALIVDGKLCNSGTKRPHESTEADNVVHCIKEYEEGVGVGRNHHHEKIDSPKTKKLKESCNVYEQNQVAKCTDVALKRKGWFESISPVKRVKASDSYSDLCSPGHEEHDQKRSCFTKFRCGYQMSENMKRIREDEVTAAAAASCKRIR